MTPEFQFVTPFIAASSEGLHDSVCIFGVGYDGTASFRPGTRNGPAAIRDASYGLETYSVRADADLEDINLVDVGDLPEFFGGPNAVCAATNAAMAALVAGGAKPIMLGGEHSLTPAAVHACLDTYPDLAVVQFDAHADLRADYLGEPWSHACAMRRVLDRVDSVRLIQHGIRSGTREEFQELKSTNRWTLTLEAFSARLELINDLPIYVTVDLDVFDPSMMPGTGTPEPGGIDWSHFESLLGALKGLNVVAADVMELSPGLDPTGCSSVLAAKVVRELALTMAG